MTSEHHVTPSVYRDVSALRLLRDTTVSDYRKLMADISERIANRVDSTQTPSTHTSAYELAVQARSIDFDQTEHRGEGIGGTDMLAELDELFLDQAVWYHHPHYLSHLNCPVDVHAVAAESVLAAVNTSVDTYDQSRIGTFIEQQLIQWICERTGFSTGDGVFTSGGTQSNLHAMLLAREAALAGYSGSGRGERQQRLAVLTTAESHFSIAKSALILGLSEDAVVSVATDDNGRMDPDALQASVQQLYREGRVPMAVSATAGTTDRGVIDPLEDIATISAAHQVWFHVDAAYGCGLLVSEENRHKLSGIDQADSVTVDFHKAYFQPISSSALLVRQPADLSRAAWHADYLNPADSTESNQVDKSLQTTRRFDALKLYATLRGTGPAALGRAWDTLLNLAEDIHQVVTEHPAFELQSQTDLTTVLFRWQPEGVADEDADVLVGQVRQMLQESGQVMVATTTLNGRPCFKFTLMDPETTVGNIDCVLERIADSAHALYSQRGETPDTIGAWMDSAETTAGSETVQRPDTASAQEALR